MPNKILIPVAAATIFLAACGQDEKTTAARSATPSAAAVDGEPARYCELAKELDRAGGKFFAALEADDDATPEDYEAAEREMLLELAPEFAALEAAATPEIEADVAVVLKAQRERAGLESSETPGKTVAKSESALKAFERREC